ncbi:MAG: hypothetical protein AB7P08_06115 [Burkholderiales bacterium]
MNDTIRALRAFADDVAAHSQAKQRDSNYAPSEEERARREQVMQSLLTALGLSRKELQSKLRIDKSTWDRWRAMTSIPHASYLQALERFASERTRSEEASDDAMPAPLVMLNDGPKTWGCLRVVFSLHDWDNVILHFKSPWEDADTAVEMACLALKKTRLVYFKSEPERWWATYRNHIVKALGKTYAARALSRVCVIARELPVDMGQFAILNYEAPRPMDRVGYKWLGQDKRPLIDVPNVYEAVSGSNDLFEEVHERYGPLIQRAFGEIDKRTWGDFWSTDFDKTKMLDEMPVVRHQDEVASLKKKRSVRGVVTSASMKKDHR